MIISLAVSFAMTLILYKPEEKAGEPEASGDAPSEEKKPLVETIELASPLTGSVIPLTEVEDPVFAGGVLGEGIAIIRTRERYMLLRTEPSVR